jgi:hypothetical protein
MVKDQNVMIDDLKKKVQACESKPKAKPAVKKKAAPPKSAPKKPAKSKKAQ